MTRARTRSRARGHGGAAAPFSPLALSPSCWLRADLGVTHVANAVSTWADQSGNGRDFTQGVGAARPTLQSTGGPSSQACIDFDGTNDLATASAASGFVSASAYTCFCVFKADAISTSAGDATAYDNDGPWGDSSANVGFFLRNAPSDQGLAYNWDGSSDVVPFACEVGDWHVAEQRHESGTLYARLHDVAEASTASGNTTALTAAMRIGSVYATAAQYFDGQIAELIWWSRALSLAERQLVRAYLTTRYGLAWS